MQSIDEFNKTFEVDCTCERDVDEYLHKLVRELKLMFPNAKSYSPDDIEEAQYRIEYEKQHVERWW